ncbi:MAG: type II toxin-antitoxin system RelE/ParE family toxin [Ignavibacteria bacterium]|nr:type II toxin-antitoxin system RelE/ParE family toxin [Ignavibacteria bacterium]
MIKSFADKVTKELYERQKIRRLPANIFRTAYKKLLIIDAAEELKDLSIPPGNHLEKMSGKLKGKYSIRINDQWRIIFEWFENNAYKVQIIDYHKK